ncbi:MAG: aldehyde ferredoxin oxidoreductase family protein [Actinobacteria bacterium]|nr:aldehyde ferredoxin oxidoreductase family protein [Actinomycetota bacterium]
MLGGYMGLNLEVDLTKGTVTAVPLDEQLAREYVGGYGLAARMLYDRIKPGIDPMGPANVLGFFTGPLTGSPSIEGNRFVVVCKSPLTGGWGDANCGGTFGPALKAAGFDNVIFSGAASKPVYLFIDDGKAELRDASDLWGKDSNETEDILRARHGEKKRGGQVQVACIGQAGEKLSRIACVMNDYGRAAGRSGVGGVMGSKKVKAIVAKGNRPLPMADAAGAEALRKKYLPTGQQMADQSKGAYTTFVEYGTIGITGESSYSGDSPVKNWGGVGLVDFPQGATSFEQDHLIETYQDRKYGCWHCTMACGGHMSVKEGKFKGLKHHKVEYETAASWGTMNLMDSFPHLIKINELCNRYGFDTISAGCTASFAVECFENGILTAKDTGGVELRWGDGDALIELLHLMAKRDGIGDILADGVKLAAQRIGRGSEHFAIHVDGQEVPMHDPKFEPGLATTYKLDATPARHTQGGELVPPPDVDPPSYYSKYNYSGKAEWHKFLVDAVHIVNSAGVCLFAWCSYPHTFVPDFLTAVTGEAWSLERMLQAGERVAHMRHAFNLREGINPLNRYVPPRLLGVPPQTAGNVRGVTVDIDTQVREYCEATGWDTKTAIPKRDRLEKLGMQFLVKDLHRVA